jgi:hypothetical protein
MKIDNHKDIFSKGVEIFGEDLMELLIAEEIQQLQEKFNINKEEIELTELFGQSSSAKMSKAIKDLEDEETESGLADLSKKAGEADAAAAAQKTDTAAELGKLAISNEKAEMIGKKYRQAARKSGMNIAKVGDTIQVIADYSLALRTMASKNKTFLKLSMYLDGLVDLTSALLDVDVSKRYQTPQGDTKLEESVDLSSLLVEINKMLQENNEVLTQYNFDILEEVSQLVPQARSGRGRKASRARQIRRQQQLARQASQKPAPSAAQNPDEDKPGTIDLKMARLSDQNKAALGARIRNRFLKARITHAQAYEFVATPLKAMLAVAQEAGDEKELKLIGYTLDAFADIFPQNKEAKIDQQKLAPVISFDAEKEKIQKQKDKFLRRSTGPTDRDLASAFESVDKLAETYDMLSTLVREHAMLEFKSILEERNTYNRWKTLGGYNK